MISLLDVFGCSWLPLSVLGYHSLGSSFGSRIVPQKGAKGRPLLLFLWFWFCFGMLDLQINLLWLATTTLTWQEWKQWQNNHQSVVKATADALCPVIMTVTIMTMEMRAKSRMWPESNQLREGIQQLQQLATGTSATRMMTAANKIRQQWKKQMQQSWWQMMETIISRSSSINGEAARKESWEIYCNCSDDSDRRKGALAIKTINRKRGEKLWEDQKEKWADVEATMLVIMGSINGSTVWKAKDTNQLQVVHQQRGDGALTTIVLYLFIIGCISICCFEI